MALKENVGAFAVKQALSYMDKDPEKNLPKLLDWFDRFDRKDTLKVQRDAVRQVVMDKDNNWHQLVMSLWADALPSGAATAISTPTETLSPARLSTTRIRISGKKLCWKRISRRCSWDTMTTSHGTTICSVHVRSAVYGDLAECFCISLR